jgi:hypothetical protein
MNRTKCLVALCLIVSSAVAVYGDKNVYPGAKLNAEETEFAKQVGIIGSCYTTEDSVSKVIAYYMKLPGIMSMGTDDNGGIFVSKEDNPHKVYIKVASPWQPSKGGEMKSDTQIVITSIE